MRYKTYIEQSENLYLPDTPKLITPDSDEVFAFVISIKNEVEPYDFKSNFYEASIKVLEKLEAKISILQLPIQYWQTPSETLLNGIGDMLDYYSLLCSILISLGGVATKVLVLSIEDNSKVVVYSEDINNNVLLFEHSKEVKKFKNKELMFKYLIDKNNSDITAYEFNDKLYRDLTLPLFSS